MSTYDSDRPVTLTTGVDCTPPAIVAAYTTVQLSERAPAVLRQFVHRATYCFGPMTGPSPTGTKPDGTAPPASQATSAASARVSTADNPAAFGFCGTTAVQQPNPAIPDGAVALARIR